MNDDEFSMIRSLSNTIKHIRHIFSYAGIATLVLIAVPSETRAAPPAGEWVSFHMATTPPTTFKVRQAKKMGVVLKPEMGTNIGGILYLPNSSTPAPAVVLIHGCRGVQEFQKTWGARISEWGYAALLIDSFGPRNVDASQVCANMHAWDFREEIAGRSFDVFGALKFLSKQPNIDGGKLAVIGWDGATALSNMSVTGVPDLFDIKLSGAIAMSPDCRQMIDGELAAPLLVLTGDKNDWWPADRCKTLWKNSKKRENSMVTLKIYEDTFHSFDDPSVGKKLYLANAFNPFKMPTKGATLGYNAVAHKDAQKRIKSFLSDIFK